MLNLFTQTPRHQYLYTFNYETSQLHSSLSKRLREWRRRANWLVWLCLQ